MMVFFGCKKMLQHSSFLLINPQRQYFYTVTVVMCVLY